MARPRLDETRMRQGLVLLAAVQLFLGAFLAIAPGTFVDTLAPYGDAADHFLRDVATFYLAMGAALLLAIGRRAWRVPILFLVFLQYAFHSVNHLIDIGGTDPGWLGPFNFVSLVLITFVTGYLLAAAARTVR